LVALPLFWKERLFEAPAFAVFAAEKGAFFGKVGDSSFLPIEIDALSLPGSYRNDSE
jgi:hypothetical protein